MIKTLLENFKEPAAITLLVAPAREVEFECCDSIGDSLQLVRGHRRF